jgi:hypothetical protein
MKRGKKLPSLSSTGRFGTEGAGAGWRAVTAYDCPKGVVEASCRCECFGLEWHLPQG